jgi:hypothetical protein
MAIALIVNGSYARRLGPFVVPAGPPGARTASLIRL